MYSGGVVLGASTVTSAVILPNTGGNMIVTFAAALFAGLVTWGVLYFYSNK